MLPPTISTAELKELTTYSAAGLTLLEREGIIKRSGHNTWAMPETVLAIVRYLRSRTAARGEADKALKLAKQRELEQRLAERARQLIPVAQATEAVETLVGVVLVELGGLAARSSRDTTVRRRIDDEVYAARVRISAKLATIGQAIRDGTPPDEALAMHGAGRTTAA
jgi:hypothetical protein